MRKNRDIYFELSKKNNYQARSVYKLMEINDKKKLFKPGMKVLDLGCSPGSWSQYISEKIGDDGMVYGIDLKEVKLNADNFRFAQIDVHDFKLEAFEDPPDFFDVIVSDMAPKTTGIKSLDSENSKNLCLIALEIAEKYLKPSGNFLVKIFQGASFQDYLNKTKSRGLKFEIIRPKAVRSESKEVYIYVSGSDK